VWLLGFVVVVLVVLELVVLAGFMSVVGSLMVPSR